MYLNFKNWISSFWLNKNRRISTIEQLFVEFSKNQMDYSTIEAIIVEFWTGIEELQKLKNNLCIWSRGINDSDTTDKVWLSNWAYIYEITEKAVEIHYSIVCL